MNDLDAFDRIRSLTRLVRPIAGLSALACVMAWCSGPSGGGVAPAGSDSATTGTLVGDPVNHALPPSINTSPAPTSGDSRRVGGDERASVSGSDGDYRYGPCRIDTPLPVGYPPPTPPGAIDLKTYPAVRIAEVSGTGGPDRGMNRAFWPLFNHIKKHDIAMTAPVEMYYTGLGGSGRQQPEAWSMAFLYRTPDLNSPGVEGSVTVRDAPPVTVLAAGIKGDYSMALVERGRAAIEEFLAANPQWQVAGDWRALYYNGPSLMFWNKWAEVQVPVRPAAQSTPGRSDP